MVLYPILIAFLLYFSSIPIAFALFASALIYFIFGNTGSPVDLVLQRFITSTASFPLLAVPFFIMAGSIMNYSGISSRLMKMADVLTGHMKGGLAQVNVVLSTLMGGISGSANADAAMQSKILVPEMEKRGYGKAFSAAITAASSAISPVIPPGINLIIYALIAQVSVGQIFLAGYIPGFIMCICLMFTVSLISKKRDYKPSRDKRASFKEIVLQLRESIWALFLPFGIILGLRFGVFTPTEGGAMAVLFCTLIGFFVYKELKISHFKEILKDTILGTSTVVLIIVSASIFGYYMTWERIPQNVSRFLLDITNNKYLMLLFINIIFLVIGMFLEGGAALIILAPLFVPVVVGLGVDPVHFGLISIVNIMIGGITPPFGSMMFTTCSITGVSVIEFVKEVIPFIIALLVALLIVTYLPWVVLFLPNLVY
ncbi:TRAP transporter, DctM subunit [Anaerobranca californiensis DSM 14826]|jgi:tripartite ATP-independent transporter DctM subunit|uniref:TRAP transporter, DctM subunit n=1 Tax=Anaerobranca californiensis DSM 14826 TaxID=1120989 RepID=A0A1M6RCY8_9FIRM|nr:TRAP transporter large permease [Anaerobranca californiensis]SHK30208.1 TRAP transporter, DctM subunit [Anaerobranca californiensis DSM 14826]